MTLTERLLVRQNPDHSSSFSMRVGSKPRHSRSPLWACVACTVAFFFVLVEGFAQTAMDSSCRQATLKVKRGQELLAQGDGAEAIQELKLAQSLCSEKEDIALALARAYLATQQFAQAEETTRRFLAQVPASEAGQLLLADCYFAQRRFPEAATTLQKLLAQNRANVDALRQLGIIAFTVGDQRNAEQIFREVLSRRPEDAEVLDYLGGVYYFKGDYKRAIETFEKILVFRPSAYEAYDRVASCYQAMQDTETAIQFFKKAGSLSPRKAPPDDGPFTHLAQTLIMAGRKAEAVPSAREAVRINPNASLNQFLLGNALFHAGELTEAILHLRKAAELDPNDPQPHFVLGNIYKKLAQTAESQREFAKFQELTKKAGAKNPSNSTPKAAARD